MFTITIEVPEGYLFESTVNDVVYQWDPAKMTNAAKLYQMEYGGQRVVNDRCGGKDKTAEDKAKIATTFIDRLISDTFAERVSRSSVDPILAYVRAIIRTKISEANGESWKSYKAAKGDSDKRNDMLDAIFAKQSEEKQDAIYALAVKAKAQADAAKVDATKATKTVALDI